MVSQEKISSSTTSEANTLPMYLFYLLGFLIFFLPGTKALASDSLLFCQESYAQAETAMAEGRFYDAIPLYQELLALSAPAHWIPASREDLLLRLASAYHRAGDLNNTEALLKQMEGIASSLRELEQLTFLKAHLYLDRQQAKQAYRVLKSLDRLYPKSCWHAPHKALYLTLSYSLDKELASTLHQAEWLFRAKLYKEAIPFYETVYDAICAGDFPQGDLSTNAGRTLASSLREHLMESYFQQNDFRKLLEVANTLPAKEQGDSTQIFWMQALAKCRLGRYAEAKEELSCYLASSKNDDHYMEALFELGCCCYHLQQYDLAKPCLLAALQHPLDATTSKIAMFYLSDIDAKTLSSK